MKRTTPSLKSFKPAVATALAIVIACIISVRAAQAGYIVTLQQVGSNVVANGSGPLDLTGLSFGGLTGFGPQINPSPAFIVTGALGMLQAAYTGTFSGPGSFGPAGGSPTFENTGTGDNVGIAPFLFGQLYVPTTYISNTALFDTGTYAGATFASLGVTPGIYEWTWGTGANQNFTLEIGTVPDSGSTFGLLSLSVVALLGVTRLRFLQLAA